MIVHSLRFTFREETTAAQQDRVLELMRRTASVESVSFGGVGRVIGDSAAGYTHGLWVGLADLDALRRYLYDPVHLAGDPEIVPHLSRLIIGPDISDDPDPELSAKVTALANRKLADYPDWAALMGSVPDFALA